MLVSDVCRAPQEVQQEVQQTCWSRHSDPVLSLIEEVSQEERGEVYPDIHMEHPITRPSQAPGEGTEIRGGPSEGLSPQTGYKPQTSAPVPPPQEPKGEEEEAREERQGETPGGEGGHMEVSLHPET